MLLARLVATSAAVTATSKRTAKRELLAELLADLEPHEVEPAVGFLIGSPRQGALGVGWATVAKVAAHDGSEPGGEASITVADLDATLTELKATEGEGSNQARRDLLAELFRRATAAEHDYVGRLLTGGLRQGALAGVVTDAVASAAGVKLALMRRATMLQGDLPQAARIALVDGSDGLAAVDLAVGRPIQPMLASTAADVAEAVETLGRVQVEWKLDGARIQVHRDGDEVRIYTRNLNDVTARLPQISELVRSFDCASVVLDGEVIGGGMIADPSDADAGDGADGGSAERPVAAFQDTMSAFGSDAEAGAAHGLAPYFFDLMFLDGRSLIDVELGTRSDLLEALAGEHQIPRLVTDDAAAAAEHLDAALAAGHEGVMVKAVDSVYEAGRRGKTWRKIKPVHTLDLVVLAAEWGHGRRQGWLSNLHLGARNPETGELVMVGKTFKGLTDEVLAWQTEKFLARKAGEHHGGHTVEVRPELVVEIAVDGAQRSTRYPGGVALRFARVRGYRPDKLPADADTLDAVRALL